MSINMAFIYARKTAFAQTCAFLGHAIPTGGGIGPRPRIGAG